MDGQINTIQGITVRRILLTITKGRRSEIKEYDYGDIIIIIIIVMMVSDKLKGGTNR